MGVRVRILSWLGLAANLAGFPGWVRECSYASMLGVQVNLQIGHAYREKRDFGRALAAYQAVPADSPAAREAAAAIDALQTENGTCGR